MDLLSRLLNELRINSTTISRWTIFPDVGINVENFAPGYLLSVVSGPALSINYGKNQVLINPGEAIFAIRGGDCTLGTLKATQFFKLDELEWEGYSGVGYSLENPPSSAVTVTIGRTDNRHQIPTVMVGFAFTLKSGGVASLSEQLPEFIHLSQSFQETNKLMNAAINFLVNDKEPGCLAAAVQLAEFIVTNALRGYLIKQSQFPVGILRGLSDHRIGRVIQLISEAFTDKLTLQQLAREAGMSRSAFAEHFVKNIGETPINYVNRIRVQKAIELLSHSRLNADDIAQRCGFGGARSMRLAFKRITGQKPKDFRQKAS